MLCPAAQLPPRWVCLLPSHAWGPLATTCLPRFHPLLSCAPGSTSCLLRAQGLPAATFFCCDPSLPCCPTPLPLPVWMNVCISICWLLDFHTVQFSVSYGSYFVSKFLSLFWLCEKAQCVYLHLHLGQKFFSHFFKLDRFSSWY
ncbi:hypothetical protein HJG60_011488 [Phyllostomus discolor]|uniref:Uncharacterized protein n=1 Tax=Phyllostomus discolor TaxID=89673 RepID=A0A833ZTQ4_9CHIR|nr:hypothetical protein HJG60_011488 [Phyllostomus discolor]